MTARTDLLAQAKPQKVETTKSSSSSKKRNAQQPPAKKRKTALKGSPSSSKTEAPEPGPQFKGKRKRAKLTIITEMPMDILFEIFGFLHPLDLLHLARANKVLRGVVLSRQAQCVWKNAFQTQEVLAHPPPPLPDSISWPQYAALLYDQYCQVCSSRFGNMVHWLAHLRFCAKCVDKRFITKSDLDDEWMTLCKYQHFPKVRVPGKYYDSGYIALKAEYESRLTQIETLLDDGKEAEAEELRKQWSTEYQNIYKIITPYLLWQTSMKKQGASARLQKHLARRKAIDAKVRAAGYSDNEVGMWLRRCQLPAYKGVAPLTDKGWTRIEDDVLSVFAYRRQQNDRAKLTAQYARGGHALGTWLYRSYPELCLASFIVPTPADFAKLEPFRSLIQKAAAKNEIPRNELLQGLKNKIPEIITTWKASAQQLLVDLLPAPPKRSKLAVEDRLSLATTFFKCHWCTEPISYPRILMHSCLRNRRSEIEESEAEGHENGDDDNIDDGENDADDSDTRHQNQQKPRVFIDSSPEAIWKAMAGWYGSQWNEDGEQITFDDEASRLAHNIVLACGYPPESTGMSVMDESNLRLECTRCTKASRKPQRLIMTWKQALLHDIKMHFEENLKPSGWKLVVDEHDLSTVRAKEESQEKTALLYYCKSCLGQFQDSGSTCSKHVIHAHRIPAETLPEGNKLLKMYYMLKLDQGIKTSSPLPVKI